MDLIFHKYQGTGNDFIMIDDRDRHFPSEDEAFVKHLCDRHFGIGADGLILVQNIDDYAFYMDYFNSDGKRSSMCGNGGRCTVQFAQTLGIIQDKVIFLAVDGPHEAMLTDYGVKLQMIEPENFEKLGGTDYFVNTGSPHMVRMVQTGDIKELDVFKEGRLIRYSTRWHRQGVNVNFVRKQGENEYFVRTYERGVENETLSCGTGVTAAAVVHAQLGGSVKDPVLVHTLGGDLRLHLDQGKGPWLEGPATFVFEGKITLPDA